jgi:PST family polysaccharide transporter
MGVALTLLTAALAPAVANFYGEPRVRPMLWAMSGSMLLIGFNNWPRVLLSRELRFAQLNQIETLAALGSTVAMIAAALLGAGAYAFVVFLLVSEALLLIGAWQVCSWRPIASVRWKSLGPLMRHGADLTGHNLLLYFVQQIDTLLMGRWFGAHALGLYARPAQLVVIPGQHIAAPIGQVLLATLARVGPGAPQFARLTREATNLMAHLTLPVAAVAVAVPDVMIRVLFGAAWLDAAPLLRWVALTAAASYLTAGVYPLCVATGATRRLAAMSALCLGATAIGLWFGRPYGPVGLAAGAAIANVALIIPRLWWATRNTPVPFAALTQALIGPLCISVALGAGLNVARRLAVNLPMMTAILITTCGGALAALLVVILSPRIRAEFQYVWQHRPGAQPP